MDYEIVMPYIGGILSDNAYKYATRGTKPIVKFWKKELAERAQALDIPQAEEYEVQVFGKFADERRPDIANLFKVIGDGLKKTRDYSGLGTDDKHFKFKDMGYELGHLDPELEITIIPMEEKMITFGDALNDRVIARNKYIEELRGGGR